MVLPQTGILQFPTGAGNVQKSAAIGISSTQEVAYVAGVTPNGAVNQLQNFVIDISDPTEITQIGTEVTFNSEEEGSLPDDVPRSVAVFDDGEAGTGDIVYVVGGTGGDLTNNADLLVNRGQQDAFLLQYTPDTDGNLIPTDEDGNPINPTAYQFGGAGSEIILDSITVADADGHSIYVVGRTTSGDGGLGDFFGGAVLDDFDAFVAKIDAESLPTDSSGLSDTDFEWITRIESVANDEAVGVDFADGVLYVVGNTEGDLNADGGSAGDDNNSDVWIAAIQDDPDDSGVIEAGEIIVNEFDSPGVLATASDEVAADIAVSSGQIYIAGTTEDVVDSNDVAAQDITASIGNEDAFLAKFQTGTFSDTAEPLFVEQFGSFNEDIAVAVEASTRTTDGDDDIATVGDRSQVTTVFVTGTTEGVIEGDGELNKGAKDVFVAQFDDRQGNNPVLQLDEDVAGTDEAVVALSETFVADNVSLNDLIIGTVNAGDPEGFPLAYSITAGNTSGAFGIDTDTGEITVADENQIADDFSDSFSLTVEVDAVDQPDPTITPDTTPQIADQQFVFKVGDANVGTVTFDDGTDPNPSVFEITGGNPDADIDGNELFDIDPTTGVITINTAETLADEVTGNSTFNLTVTIADDLVNVGTFDEIGDDNFSSAAIQVLVIPDLANDTSTDDATIDIEFEAVELTAGLPSIDDDPATPDNVDLLGTRGQDNVRDIAVDRGGNFYIVGDTSGQFLEADAGAEDIDNFAVRFGDNEVNPVVEAGDDVGGGGAGATAVTPTQSISPTLGERLEADELNNGFDLLNNSSFTFAVEYAATEPLGATDALPDGSTPLNPNDAQSVADLGGFGVRIHFNSDEVAANAEPGLTFVGVDNLFDENGTVSIVSSNPVEDTDDFDADPSTDAFVTVTFLNPDSNFPGFDSNAGESVTTDPPGLVDQLFDITFDTNPALFDGNPSVTQDPVINFTADERFLADGFSFGTNANNGEVFGRQATNGNRDISLTVDRYTFDVDDNGEVNLLSDGLQIFNAISKQNTGFADDFDSGDVIEGPGAIASDANRDQPADIFDYLKAGLGASANGNESIFDIDGDGDTTLLQDGILLLRFISGFTGENLTDDLAFGATAQRTTADTITSYINNFIPGAEVADVV